MDAQQPQVTADTVDPAPRHQRSLPPRIGTGHAFETVTVGFPERVRPDSDFSGVLTSVLKLRPLAMAQVGLLVLVATPVVRVLASVVGFVLEGDRLYATITLGVLAILLVSLFGLR